jgi:hypothetical protein
MFCVSYMCEFRKNGEREREKERMGAGARERAEMKEDESTNKL